MMKINKLISKMLLMGSVVFALSACTDEPDGGSGSGSGSKPKVTVDNLIGSLNVGDAKMIYRKEPEGGRATWENEYYKLDANGNEVKLVLKGQFPVPGDTTGTLFEEHRVNVELTNLVKLTDRYLMFQPEPTSLGLAVDSINGDDRWSRDYWAEYYGFTYLIDIPTEKAYRVEGKISYDENLNAQADADGNIFFRGSYLDEPSTVMKLDATKMRLGNVLEAGQAVQDFTVLPSGILIYGDRALTTGGAIVVIDGSMFILNDEIYSLEVTEEPVKIIDPNNAGAEIPNVHTDILTIYRWEPRGSRDLRKRKVAQTRYEDNGIVYFYNRNIGNGTIMTNPKKNKVYIQTNCVSYDSNVQVDWDCAYEFDGEKLTLNTDLNTGQWIGEDDWNKQLGFSSSEAKYAPQVTSNGSISTNSFLKFDYDTERFSIVKFDKYDFYSLQADVKQPNVTFSGIRLRDQKKVAGYFTPTDDVEETAVSSSGLKYSSLIAL